MFYSLPIVGEDPAGEHRLGTKIKQKAYLDLGRFEVVDELSRVLWRQTICGFKFHYDAIIHHYVSEVLTDA